MHVILLYQSGKQVRNIQERLAQENVQTEKVNIDSINLERFTDTLGSAHALILLIQSPTQKKPLELALEIRKKTKIPIICMDEHYDSETEIFGKKAGISFYFHAPFSFPEIALKLKFMVYRKIRSNGNLNIRIDDLIIDFLSRQIRRKKQPIQLRGREFAIMEYFMLNHGKVLTRNMILEQVWDRNTNILSNTIDVHIARLRKKLESPEKKYFHTFRSLGYKFEPLPVKPAVKPEASTQPKISANIK